MLRPFEDQFLQHWPVQDWSDVTVLIAVSGGADSIALLRVLSSLRSQSAARLVVAHYNHRLRGADSQHDANFVRDLAKQLDLEFIGGTAETQTDTGDPRTDGLATATSEDSARNARYQFLRQAAADCGARFVVTAHTADDQVETVLHRLLRGTGLQGLAGIPPARQFILGVSLRRPLLWATRQQILGYLNELDQPFRIDRTNSELNFTRNRLRHQLLPLLEREYNPRVREAILRLAALAGEAHQSIERQATAMVESAVTSAGEHFCTLDCGALRDCDSYLLRQVLVTVWQARRWPLQAMTSTHWRDLELLAGDNPNRLSQSFPGGIQATREGDALHLLRGET